MLCSARRGPRAPSPQKSARVAPRGASPYVRFLALPVTELDRHWPAIQAHLRGAVPDAVHQIWFEQLRPVALDGPALTVAAPDAHVGWLVDRFARVLQTSAAAELGPDASVDVVPAGTLPSPAATADRPAPAPGPRTIRDEDPLSPGYTFDQFVIGEGNRLAHAAALAVAEQPGQAYNPLFLYGPPGVGKTHLLHSIAHYVRAHGSGLTVRYTTVEAFTTGFVSALRGGDVGRFKAAYRDVDVLLIDDIQFLEDKARTEEEFFHTFNALHDTGGQLVLTSDRLPRDMAALEERLRERFESGLVADITAPDFHTRLTILRKRAAHDRLGDIDPRALEVIAERVADNVRALEGALVRVAAFHSLRHPGEAITPALVAHVLDKLYPVTHDRHRTTVRDVQDAVGRAFDLDVDELISPQRTARVSWPRQVAMYLSRELTDATLPAIGRAFGGRDHATVLYAIRRARDRLSSDPDAYDLVRSLTERLHAPDGDRPN